MPYNGIVGSSFLKKYLRTGELVNLFDIDWIERRREGGVFRVNPAGVGKYPDCYYVLALDPYRKETAADLARESKAIANVIGLGKSLAARSMHKPDFFIFNISNGKAIAFGLGRRARSFVYLFDGVSSPISKSLEDYLARRDAFKVAFDEADAIGAVDFLLAQFAEIGEGFEEFGPLPIFPETAQEILDGENDEDGDGLTEDELREIVAVGTAAEKKIDMAEEHFRDLFSKCTCLSWELNPEDY